MTPELVEAVARQQAIRQGYAEPWWDDCVARFGSHWSVLQAFRDDAQAAIALIAPAIRAQALEEAAQRLDREWPGAASSIVRALITS